MVGPLFIDRHLISSIVRQRGCCLDSSLMFFRCELYQLSSSHPCAFGAAWLMEYHSDLASQYLLDGGSRPRRRPLLKATNSNPTLHPVPMPMPRKTRNRKRETERLIGCRLYTLSVFIHGHTGLDWVGAECEGLMCLLFVFARVYGAYARPRHWHELRSKRWDEERWRRRESDERQMFRIR